MNRALIVAHGQPGDPGPQQAAVEMLARLVGTELPEARVSGATLAMPGALDGTDDETIVYPMFMAKGWFTRSELPRRLALVGAGDARVLAPFGSDPGLPGLCLDLLRVAAEGQGWPLGETRLLIAAHGSGRSRAPAQAAQDMAAALGPHVGGVSCGFIEEEPRLADAARDLPERTLCLPLFATRAEHVTDDLPLALSAAGFRGLTMAPVGMAPQVPRMIADTIRSAIRDGATSPRRDRTEEQE